MIEKLLQQGIRKEEIMKDIGLSIGTINRILREKNPQN